jgi:mRNA interferase RelE/StbE
MGYKIVYGKTAEKYLNAQTQSTRERIMDAVRKLPDGNVMKLKGRVEYRLTVGGFRVLFYYSDESTIYVATIAPRGDVYKK